MSTDTGDSKQTSRRIVHELLSDLQRCLQREYLIGQLLCEADAVCSIVAFLRQRLAHREDFWMVGCEHNISSQPRYRPDVVVYHAPGVVGVPEDFNTEPYPYVVAIIEAKMYNQNRDFDKLTEMRKEYPQALLWHVFGDHFSEGLHNANWRGHLKIENKSNEWVVQENEKGPHMAGNTILKCCDDSMKEFAGLSMRNFQTISDKRNWITSKRIQEEALPESG